MEKPNMWQERDAERESFSQDDFYLFRDHYQALKFAVEDGRHLFSVQDVARAIVEGLKRYPGDHINNVISLMKALGEETGEPVKVDNLADNHE